VLIVEENPTTRHLYESMVRAWGSEGSATADGEAA